MIIHLRHQDVIISTFQDIVSDELKKIRHNSPIEPPPNHDDVWEYDCLHTAYQGDCEEMLLQMQRIFYGDLWMEESRKESEMFVITWHDEEDGYLSRAVYKHMQLNNEQVVCSKRTIEDFLCNTVEEDCKSSNST